MPVIGENKVRIEKSFQIPADRLFQALSDGKLFFNCGGDCNAFENNFKVGGDYKLSFPAHEITTVGKYKEIVLNKKIVFTWGDAGSSANFPNSVVSIELFADGNSTRLVLEHTGFQNKEQAEDHDGGWNSGLTDMAGELQNNQLRIVRYFDVPIEKLFSACSQPQVFFGMIAEVPKSAAVATVGGHYLFKTDKGEISGRFLELIPNKRIVFTWEKGCSQEPMPHSKVTLNLEESDDGSTLELIHSGLPDADTTTTHREGWTFVTGELLKTIK
jgi:uncharacterized protein YndB with AHSA1/START domain